jgi:endonuclease/exonuclease/phosphatase family metal-dependent hydrolase
VDPFTVMTFNVRCDTDADGLHAWRHRRDLVIETIRAHDPDLLGLQEPTRDQWKDIAAALPGSWSFETGDGELDLPGGFVRTDRFDLG